MLTPGAPLASISGPSPGSARVGASVSVQATPGFPPFGGGEGQGMGLATQLPPAAELVELLRADDFPLAGDLGVTSNDDISNEDVSNGSGPVASAEGIANGSDPDSQVISANGSSHLISATGSSQLISAIGSSQVISTIGSSQVISATGNSQGLLDVSTDAE